MKNQLFFPTDVRYSLKPIALLIEISNKKHCCFMNLWICFAPVLYPYANEWMLRITFNTTQINEDIYFAHFNLFVRILSVSMHADWCFFLSISTTFRFPRDIPWFCIEHDTIWLWTLVLLFFIMLFWFVLYGVATMLQIKKYSEYVSDLTKQNQTKPAQTKQKRKQQLC